MEDPVRGSTATLELAKVMREGEERWKRGGERRGEDRIGDEIGQDRRGERRGQRGGEKGGS